MPCSRWSTSCEIWRQQRWTVGHCLSNKRNQQRQEGREASCQSPHTVFLREAALLCWQVARAVFSIMLWSIQVDKPSSARWPAPRHPLHIPFVFPSAQARMAPSLLGLEPALERNPNVARLALIEPLCAADLTHSLVWSSAWQTGSPHAVPARPLSAEYGRQVGTVARGR